MTGGGTPQPVYRFGAFELQTATRELRKHGMRIKLQEQPLQILVLLLENAGDLVTRQHIQTKLWDSGTHVDYDNAINSAVRKLREALGDDPGNPRFIETFARRGYRFVGDLELPFVPVSVKQSATPPPLELALLPPGPTVLAKSRKGLMAGASGAVLALGLAAGGWWLVRSGFESPAVPLNAVPLTAEPGWEDHPSLSPDGNQVAYTWGKEWEGSAHIYVKLIGEGKAVQLTSGDASDSSPMWSPDGRTIAFLRRRGSAEDTYDIYTIPALGGAARRIAEGRFDPVSLSWSPDGRFLAVAEHAIEPLSTPLILLSAQNGNRLPLTQPKAKTVDHAPAFSPDGRALIFTRFLGGNYTQGALFLLNLSTGFRPSSELRLLGNENGEISGAAWTGNGNEFVYAIAKDVGTSSHMLRMSAQAGSQPVPLLLNSEHAYWPGTAPRGHRLVYVDDLRDADIAQVHPGGQPSSFLASTRWEDSPDYSPDGQRVAFASGRSGLLQIWVCGRNGEDPVQLSTFKDGPSGSPRWSPDGRWIAFDHKEKEVWQTYVMAPDGGQVRRLGQDNDSESISPHWSGDGKWIYYSSTRTGRHEIWKRAAEGGPSLQVTYNGGLIAFESPDGNGVYYQKHSVSGLWEMPLGKRPEGTGERKILDSVHGKDFFVMNDGVYYIPEPTADGSTAVRFLSFASGRDSMIAAIRHPLAGLTVSPDRQTILFAYRAREGSNVMVVDHFQ